MRWRGKYIIMKGMKNATKLFYFNLGYFRFNAAVHIFWDRVFFPRFQSYFLSNKAPYRRVSSRLRCASILRLLHSARFPSFRFELINHESFLELRDALRGLPLVRLSIVVDPYFKKYESEGQYSAGYWVGRGSGLWGATLWKVCSTPNGNSD